MPLRANLTHPLQGFEIVMMPVAELMECRDPENPRTIDDGAMARLVSSISEHGFLIPIAFNTRARRVVGGNQRTEAAHILGLAEAPAILGDWSDAQATAIGLALNADYGEWDEFKKARALQRLEAGHYDLDLTSLPPWDIEAARATLAPLPTALPTPFGAGRVLGDKGGGGELRFSVRYTEEDEHVLRVFLGGLGTLPPQNHLGAHIIERIRSMVALTEADP